MKPGLGGREEERDTRRASRLAPAAMKPGLGGREEGTDVTAALVRYVEPQ